MTSETCVAIVGLGSRGLSVLERIVTLARRAGQAAGLVRVEVIDPTCTGAGVHDPAQPDYLLLNTTAAQVSMFPDAYTVGAEVDRAGPTLYDWATERGLRVAADGYTVGAEGRAIRTTDFLPRRVLGQYLGWFRAEVLRRAPEHVVVTLHRATAVDLRPRPDGGLVIACSDGRSVAADYAFLTTGYTPNVQADRDGAIGSPYPLPELAEQITADHTVAVNGFGLAAMDWMSCLTVGRGGRFTDDGYVPSGREPTLLFYSRSGVPFRARPPVVRFGPPYEPVVFTPARIDELRAARGGPLDFTVDVLPLVLTEMRVAYRRCQASLTGGKAAFAGDPDGVAAALDALDVRLGAFDAMAVFEGDDGMALEDGAAYQAWLAEVIRLDQAEGRRGFTGSPVKAGLDILRSLRDTLRYVVDFGGLTGPSLSEFTRHFIPLINRAVVGPQYERHSELLTLLAAGLAHAPFGPQPEVTRTGGRWTIASSRLGRRQVRQADWLVAAHVGLPAAESSASPLIDALRGRGTIRPVLPGDPLVRGVEVTRDQHPVDDLGRPNRRLWVLGPLCEGSTYYNNLVPSPEMFSRPIHDAHRCVAAMFAAARSRPGPGLRGGALPKGPKDDRLSPSTSPVS